MNCRHSSPSAFQQAAIVLKHEFAALSPPKPQLTMQTWIPQKLSNITRLSLQVTFSLLPLILRAIAISTLSCSTALLLPLLYFSLPLALLLFFDHFSVPDTVPICMPHVHAIRLYVAKHPLASPYFVHLRRHDQHVLQHVRHPSATTSASRCPALLAASQSAKWQLASCSSCWQASPSDWLHHRSPGGPSSAVSSNGRR